MPTPEATAVPVAYLTTARLDEKGQITLPKAQCDAVALDPGAPITVLQVGSGLLLIPEEPRFRALCERIATTFARHGKQAQDVVETLPEARQQVFARHYPQLAATVASTGGIDARIGPRSRARSCLPQGGEDREGAPAYLRRVSAATT
jgi:bifunctional DNA-binding transcriptional regulator/antitoxin component of YhaV-PrlF toxin-antitoxin module